MNTKSVHVIKLGEIEIEVLKKRIKNVHLSVIPPDGHVRISAPAGMKLENIRVYAISRLQWIKKHRSRIKAQRRESPRLYVNRESHYLWGQRYLLNIEEVSTTPMIYIRNGKIILQLPPHTSFETRKRLMDAWYREQLKAEAAPLIRKWEKILGVTVKSCSARNMKTRWGSCTPAKGSIRLNTDLARKPLQCLDYIVLHELAHLLEPYHNKHFISIMNRHMPQWKHYRTMLNQLPLKSEGGINESAE